jgi:surfactin synthase thioesterase subunit
MAIKHINLDNKSFAINYEIANNSSKNTIVFLHGWGSNKEVMKSSFSSFLPELKHIYIDMPGFGKSDNEYVLTTQDYANIIKEFLKNEESIVAIAGHSFGGKVATLLNPKNLILLSSAGIIEEKSDKVKFKIKLAKVLNSFGLGSLTKAFRSKDVNTMSESMYSTFKNVVDEDFTNSFKDFKNNALIFWGETDSATSLESGIKISSLIQDSKFYSYNGDHYFFMKYANDITTKIKDGIL